MYSTGNVAPTTDTTEDLTATWSDLGGGELEVTILRDLDTGDSTHDYILPADSDFTLGWALHDSSATLTTKHTRKGSFTTNLAEDSDDD